MEYPKLINSMDNSTITINNTCFSIGRSLTCDHIIQSLDVSRFHCIFKKNDNKWTLFDRSTNGTTVNSQLCKFNESIDLKDGDVIKFGTGNKISFVFKTCKGTQEGKEGPAVEKQNPVCSTAFLNDEVLIEEAASLLAEGLEEESSLSNSNFATDHKPLKNTEMRNKEGTDTEASSSTNSVPNNEFPKDSVQTNKTSANETVPNLDIMENELTCSICSELFIKAVTLSCSHTFCKYCIDEWKKNKGNCPICRKPITNVAPTLVLDNFIEKIISTQNDEMQETRKQLVKQREEIVTNAASSSSASGDVSVIEIFSDNAEDEDMDSDASYFSDDDYDDYYENRRNYYGGYGRCYICHESGHWANGCPFRRRR